MQNSQNKNRWVKDHLPFADKLYKIAKNVKNNF